LPSLKDSTTDSLPSLHAEASRFAGEVAKFMAFMEKDFPEGDKFDSQVVLAYAHAQSLVPVLKQCGDDLTRENVMKQAAGLNDFRSGALLPGITVNTDPNDFAPISQF
jgi:branched-chain amino acid transport system substrate-binding protein